MIEEFKKLLIEKLRPSSNIYLPKDFIEKYKLEKDGITHKNSREFLNNEFVLMSKNDNETIIDFDSNSDLYYLLTNSVFYRENFYIEELISSFDKIEEAVEFAYDYLSDECNGNEQEEIINHIKYCYKKTNYSKDYELSGMIDEIDDVELSSVFFKEPDVADELLTNYCELLIERPNYNFDKRPKEYQTINNILRNSIIEIIDNIKENTLASDEEIYKFLRKYLLDVTDIDENIYTNKMYMITLMIHDYIKLNLKYFDEFLDYNNHIHKKSIKELIDLFKKNETFAIYVINDFVYNYDTEDDVNDISAKMEDKSTKKTFELIYKLDRLDS